MAVAKDKKIKATDEGAEAKKVEGIPVQADLGLSLLPEKPEKAEQKDNASLSKEMQLENQDRNELEKKLATSIPQIFNEAQQNLLKNETPRHVIKTRKGKAGQFWDYVDTGYVIEQLNILTGFRWHFKLTSKLTVQEAKEVGEMVVTGILTVFGTGDFKDMSIEKEDCGSTELKKKSGSNEYLSYGNDLKGAISDCIKRCARQFGIALDVYSGAIKRRQDQNHPDHEITEGQRKRLEVLANDANIGHSGLKKLVNEMYDYTSTTNVKRKHFDEIAQRLLLIAVEKTPLPEMPEKLIFGFEQLDTPKAKRIALWSSILKIPEGAERNKAIDDWVTKMSAEIDRRNNATLKPDA